MTFPATILDRVVQAFINGAWEVVTPYVYQRDPMRITRGAGAERSQTQPVRCELTLDDRDGRWSPRYADGTWFRGDFGQEGDWGVRHAEWGTAFYSPEWVLRALGGRWSVEHFRPGGLEHNQDVYVLAASTACS